MSQSVELVCVDPKRIREVWPHVVHLIHNAVKRTNLSHTLDIDADVLTGDGLLWLALDRNDLVANTIKAAMTTTLVRTDSDKVCILTACGGEDMREWLPLLGRVEAYAKAEGCSRVRIYGRKGWARVLKDYLVEQIVLERPL